MEHENPERDRSEAIIARNAPVLRRARRRARPNRLARMALAAAGLLVTLVLVVAGVSFAYLGSGPISLESLQPAIAANLQSRLKPGYTVALGPTSLSHGAHGLGVGFSGLAIRDPAGHLVVGAPGGLIGLDVFALLRMEVKVRRLELDRLQLALHVGPDGALSLAAAGDDAAAIPLGPTPAGAGANNFGALVAGIAEALAGAEQPLDHLAIVDGRLIVHNDGRAASAIYDDLRLTLDRSGQSASVALSAQGPAGRWAIEARAESGAKRKLAVVGRDLAAEDFSRLDPNPPAFAFDPPISFDFSAEASPSGALTALQGAFSIGAGKFDLHDPDAPALAIDEATGKLSLDADGAYRIDRIEILAGPTHVRFAGRVAPPRPDDALWRIHLHSDDILLAGAADPAAKLDKVDLDAHADAAAAVFAIDKFTLHGPHLDGLISAEVRRVEGGAAVKLDLAGAGSVLEALRLWPTFVNPDARKWCVDNIKGGELASGSLKVDWDPAALKAVLAKQAPPAGSVHGLFSLHDAAVDLLPGLPTTTGLDATGEITGRFFHAGASHGVMDLGGGRRLAGADLSFTVPDTAPAPRMAASGSGHISGGADSLAELLTRDALKKYVGVALDPAAIKGQMQGDLKLDLTLGKGVQPEEQKFRATGSLAGLSIEKFLGNTRLEQAAVDFVADRAQIRMSGNGQVLGTPSKLELVKAGQDVGALTVTSVLDEAARAKLGFNSGPKVKGPVTLKLKAPLDKSGADVEVDLARASVDSLGGAPWKAAGKPGKATFQLKASPEAVQVLNLAIDAGSLGGRGSAVFGADGDLKSLKLAPFRMSAGDDLKLEFDGGSTPKVTIRGTTLDARGFIKAVTGGEGERDPSSLDLDIKVGSASGYNREAISGLELTASRRGGAFGAIEARGRLGEGGFSARGGDGGLVNVRAEDAGALARLLDVYGKLEGGAIDLSLRNSAEGMRGTATIKRFMIRDEPSLRQLEQAAPAPQGISRGVNPLASVDTSPPVRFEKASANFTRVGGKLDVRDGVVTSTSFGLTAQGFLDFGRDRVDLSGVYVPLQQVNNALGAIPVLGLLLTGGQNEGVFAINFRVTGAASHPTLNVNPLSGMTPGILRKMFGTIDGTAPPPDSPASSYAPTQPAR